MKYRVVFAPEAEEQLAALFRYIAQAASPETAARYTGALVDFCVSLETFPHRGTRRDDIRHGLRITHFRKRTVIALQVESDVVSILGIFHGGRNYETVLLDDFENPREH